MFSPSQELFGESSGLTLIRVPWVPKISRIVVSKNEKRRVVQRTRPFSCPQNQGHTDPDSTRLQTIDQTLEPVRTRRFRDAASIAVSSFWRRLFSRTGLT